jgi:transcriptional regulator with AAA-type ATPase domain
MGRYHWPGNVRELRNLIELPDDRRAQDRIEPHLPPELFRSTSHGRARTRRCTKPERHERDFILSWKKIAAYDAHRGGARPRAQPPPPHARAGNHDGGVNRAAAS